MGQICSICNSKKRLSIDREIVTGKSLSVIARRYKVSRDSVEWHKKHHLSGQLMHAYRKKEAQNSFELLDRINIILEKANDIFERNYEKGRDGLAIKALSESRNTIDLLAKISWMLHEAKQAELQLEREKSGEAEQEKEEEYQSSLRVLTMPELKMLQALSHKLETGDKKYIIIPEGENANFTLDIDISEHEYKDKPKQQENPKETTNMADYMDLPLQYDRPNRIKRTKAPAKAMKRTKWPVDE